MGIHEGKQQIMKAWGLLSFIYYKIIIKKLSFIPFLSRNFYKLLFFLIKLKFLECNKKTFCKQVRKFIFIGIIKNIIKNKMRENIFATWKLHNKLLES